jgi:hypothetical protein
MLKFSWAFLAQNGWYLVLALLAAYVVWVNIEDRVREAARKLRDGPAVKADPNKVQAARQRQLERHLKLVDEEKERRKAETAAGLLGTDKPAPRPSRPEPRRFFTEDNINPLFGGGGGGGACYRPQRRKGG